MNPGSVNPEVVDEAHKDAHVVEAAEDAEANKKKQSSIDIKKSWDQFLGSLMFHPASFGHVLWDVIVCLFIVYNVTATPIELAFYQDETIPILVAVNHVSDVVFILDIAINFRTAVVVVKRGRKDVIWDSDVIARQYLRGGFFLDAVSVGLPFGAGTQLFEETSRAGQVFKFLPFLKILRIFRLSALISRLFTPSPEVVKLVLLGKLLTSIVLAAHVFGCLYWIVGIDTMGQPVQDSWITAGGYHQKELVVDKYMACLYFAMMTLTTVGYGDISATSSFEMAYVTVIMLVGAVLFAFIMGMTTAAVDELITDNKPLLEQEIVMDRFVRTYDLDKLDDGIGMDIRQTLKYQWELSKSFHLERSLAILPTALRTRAMAALHRPLILRTPFFAECNAAFVRAVVTELQLQVCLAETNIITAGDISRCMYFLRHGVAELRALVDMHTLVVFRDGDFFGEAGVLLDNAKEPFTVRTADQCEYYTLGADTLRGVLRNFPAVDIRIRRTALKRIRDVRRKFAVLRHALGWPGQKDRERWGMILVVSVIEAHDLPAADLNGTSDPYCNVRIGSACDETGKPVNLRARERLEKEQHGGHPTSRERSVNRQARRERFFPDKFGRTKTTPIQYDTLDPTWQSTFAFNFADRLRRAHDDYASEAGNSFFSARMDSLSGHRKKVLRRTQMSDNTDILSIMSSSDHAPTKGAKGKEWHWPVSPFDQVLRFDVYDADEFGNDDMIAQCQVNWWEALCNAAAMLDGLDGSGNGNGNGTAGGGGGGGGEGAGPMGIKGHGLAGKDMSEMTEQEQVFEGWFPLYQPNHPELDYIAMPMDPSEGDLAPTVDAKTLHSKRSIDFATSMRRGGRSPSPTAPANMTLSPMHGNSNKKDAGLRKFASAPAPPTPSSTNTKPSTHEHKTSGDAGADAEAAAAAAAVADDSTVVSSSNSSSNSRKSKHAQKPRRSVTLAHKSSSSSDSAASGPSKKLPAVAEKGGAKNSDGDGAFPGADTLFPKTALSMSMAAVHPKPQSPKAPVTGSRRWSELIFGSGSNDISAGRIRVRLVLKPGMLLIAEQRRLARQAERGILMSVPSERRKRREQAVRLLQSHIRKLRASRGQSCSSVSRPGTSKFGANGNSAFRRNTPGRTRAAEAKTASTGESKVTKKKDRRKTTGTAASLNGAPVPPGGEGAGAAAAAGAAGVESWADVSAQLRDMEARMEARMIAMEKKLTHTVVGLEGFIRRANESHH